LPTCGSRRHERQRWPRGHPAAGFCW
jgi:hypothetical protein